MASSLTRWFVVASPTGSTQSEFFASTSISDTGDFNANFNNLNAVAGGGLIVDWGTANTFPTNSAYSPGIYIRNYQGFPYTGSFYQYLDSDDATLVTSIQQDLQKIHFPGIITGSYGGTLYTTQSLTAGIGFDGRFSLFDGGVTSPIYYNGVYSMSFSTEDIANVNQNTMLNNVAAGDQIILRNITENEEAVYSVLSKDTTLALGVVAYEVDFLSGLGPGTPNLNSSFEIDFVKTGSNQQTFYVVGVANPKTGLPFAGQSTVGTADAAGDFRSGIIKVYATESNNTTDWDSLVRTVTGDNNSTWDITLSGPSYVATRHNLFMFTASAGSVGTGSWELLVDGA